MAKILVADDEADLEMLIKQNFVRKYGSNNMNLFLPSTVMMPLKRYNSIPILILY